MEIKTKFLDECTNKTDKLLNNRNNQKIKCVLIAFTLLLIFMFVASFFLK